MDVRPKRARPPPNPRQQLPRPLPLTNRLPERGTIEPLHAPSKPLSTTCVPGCSKTAAQMHDAMLDAGLIQHSEMGSRCLDDSQFALNVATPAKGWIVRKPGALHTRTQEHQISCIRSRTIVDGGSLLRQTHPA